eukprot:COSAG01_NODE_10107_length_2249_cov_2.181395_3_plen_192_part_00
MEHAGTGLPPDLGAHPRLPPRPAGHPRRGARVRFFGGLGLACRRAFRGGFVLRARVCVCSPTLLLTARHEGGGGGGEHIRNIYTNNAAAGATRRCGIGWRSSCKRRRACSRAVSSRRTRRWSWGRCAERAGALLLFSLAALTVGSVMMRAGWDFPMVARSALASPLRRSATARVARTAACPSWMRSIWTEV